MRSKSFDGMICPIAGVMAAIGDRWGMLILRDLALGLRRYDDFRRSSGITHATLSDRLKHLEANELIERSLYQSSPARWEYLLTPQGKRVASIFPVLAQIGDELGMAGASASPMSFVHRETGAPVQWAFIDKTTGARLDMQDLAVKEGPGADDLVRWRLGHAVRHQDKKSNTASSPRTRRASKTTK